MTPTMNNLVRGRDLAWASLRPAFEHAMVLAKEAEHRAGTASTAVMQNIPPEYPPLVELLAEAGQEGAAS